MSTSASIRSRMPLGSPTGSMQQRDAARARDGVEVAARRDCGVRVRPAVEGAEPASGDQHQRAPGVAHHWSKFRRRSQSVTARLKCASSWRAVLSKWSCTSVPNASAATFDVANASVASARLDGTRVELFGRVRVAVEARRRRDAVLDAVQAGRDRGRVREVRVHVAAGDARLEPERRRRGRRRGIRRCGCRRSTRARSAPTTPAGSACRS